MSVRIISQLRVRQDQRGFIKYGETGGQEPFQTRSRPAGEGERAQMKTEWDVYLDEQLANPAVRQAYEEETRALSVAMTLARQRPLRGWSRIFILMALRHG